MSQRGDRPKIHRRTIELNEADHRALFDVAYAMGLASQSEALRRLIREAAERVGAKGA
jgi:hypothetical protein